MQLSLHNKCLLELGCGLALPSLVASKFHSTKCFVSDKDIQLLQPFILSSAALNGLQCDFSFVELNWAAFDSAAVKDLAKCVGVVVASDCLYDEREYDNLFAVMRELKEGNKEVEILLGYEDRGAFDCLEEYAECYGFRLNDEINTRFWQRLESAGIASKFNRNCYLFKLTA
eukprot:TRINITY_DN4317_c0_g4_i2.p1 TRINITY_DN4317_c0_g4~~TRINITY_DN4317_c0_g4_i2.p1  ORF type:complete len:172 (+),score=34.69 TRINITY_DN4317_c0_g4_i2:348-863(+)